MEYLPTLSPQIAIHGASGLCWLQTKYDPWDDLPSSFGWLSRYQHSMDGFSREHLNRKPSIFPMKIMGFSGFPVSAGG